MSDQDIPGDSMYREHILEHYKHPHNKGTLEKPDTEWSGRNPLCGDEIKVQLKIKDDIIEDIKFDGTGCAISQAVASMLTEEIKGKTLEEVKNLDKEHITEILGIPLGPVRLKCALLALKTIENSIKAYEEKHHDR